MTKAKINGDYINYISEGAGTPVILIHGMGASLHNWDYLIPQLVSTGYRAFAPDLPGHGESLKPEQPGDYHIEALYAHIETWIHTLELEDPFFLIGHSLGAYLALRYALKHPVKLKKLVLVDPFYSLSQLSPFLSLVTQQPQLSIKVLEAAPAWLIDPLIKYNPNVAYKLPESMVHQMALDYKRAHPNIIFTAPTLQDLTPKLPAVRHQTLVVWGENDLTLTPDSFPRLVETMPNAYGYSLPKCGHTPHLTRAHKFNQQVLSFFENH